MFVKVPNKFPSIGVFQDVCILTYRIFNLE